MEVCSPNVLVGGMFLVGLIWRSWVTPVRLLLKAEMDELGRAEHKDYLGLLLDVKVGGILRSITSFIGCYLFKCRLKIILRTQFFIEFYIDSISSPILFPR